ncbi:MAG: peptide chain release factor 1 [Acidobacteria bacterium]|nr:peptide chain release factor 1 [Acidobacteriota bacterium]
MQYAKKLEAIEARFEDLTRQMADPAVIGDNDLYRKTAKSHRDLEEVVTKYREWKRNRQDLEGARPMLEENDPELREMARSEVERLEPELKKLEEDLRILLLPKDPLDEKDVVLEIRAGAGGDEASLFAAEVFRMYSRHAEEKKWRVELTSSADSPAGGVKEVIALISGDKVYSRMKYEGGVHRVQRVPVTEAQGRIHTSTITVAVMPEADEVEIKIDPKDIRIDTFCSSGPGGQSVNTTYSAVRITHLPTGVVVSCQDEKSQIKTRSKAERVLRSRLYEMELEKQRSLIGGERRSMVGTGDRSEKIRTYNFKENRVTDHRIGLTLYQLDQVMEGRLDTIVDALTTHYQTEKLKQQTEVSGPAADEPSDRTPPGSRTS